MPRTVEILLEATAEAAESREWYAGRDAAVAARFVQEIDVAIAAITDAPDRWPVGHHDTRRYALRQFPFSVVYTFDDDRVRNIAVAHARRRPGYWEGRT